MNKRIDSSIVNKMDAYVEEIILTNIENKRKFIKIMTNKRIQTKVGDKFSSRNGQKGVIGLIQEESEFFFNNYGFSPDIIFNPHGIPSRMTYSTILEFLGGKVNSFFATNFNCDTFFGVSEIMLKKNLEKNGFKNSGLESVINPQFGSKIKNIFYGVSYYQKLIHLAEEKIFYRKKGPIQFLTRQPTEGKNKLGGIRFGEMEKDCLVAYGTSNILNEILLKNSDFYTVFICSYKTCGVILDSNFENKCNICGRNSDIGMVRIPYAFKLLTQELFALGINLKYKLA